jgi:hypothetical protein
MSSHADATSAGELLEVMRVRLDRQRRGLANPSPAVRRATETLVGELARIDPSETIVLSRSPKVIARYIRAVDGSVLAEVLQDEG